ncbi:MAG: isocitrate dehydrogenase (NADP(+)) [Spirochaetes bacterium]|nr:isocitrate dehydrogenase (NADP(+)) [Spirochaetota bacterium]
MRFNNQDVPSDAQIISYKDGTIVVPDRPTIAYIEGDGIGPDLWKATKTVVEAAVAKTFGGKKKIDWYEIFAGEKAFKMFGSYLTDDSVEAIRNLKVAIKGPLTTPVGGGFRSVNVSLRQLLDLYACVRPVRWYKGVPSPVKEPQKLNVVIYRENTEDLYAGIEWKKDSPEAKKFIEIMKRDFNTNIRPDSGIGVKPISEFGSRRLIRMALKFAIENKRRSVTFMHKGNIMKYTEGAFKDYGYVETKENFAAQTITEADLGSNPRPKDKVLVNDRIADSMFQQVLLRPDEYDVIATPNLNGDYISDACAAQVGGLGMAPGANIGDNAAVFEATHGSAPKYANLDKANPCSLILSAKMMLDHLGWQAAGTLIENAIEKTIIQKTVTYDLARQMDGAKEIATSAFAKAIVDNM